MVTITLALVAILAATASANPTALVKRAGSSGYGVPHSGKGQTKHNSTVSGGIDRDFAIYIPPDYNKDHPQGYQMLFSFHGKRKDMDYEAQLTRFNDPAVNPNMIAVFLNGQVSNLGDGDCKTYASGKSVGGGFVDVLACSPGYGGNFAAFTINAGAMYNEADGSGCTPARKPLPILQLHGTEDHAANYNGGFSHDQPLSRIRPLLQKWAERNGCMTGTAAASDVRGSKGVYKTYWNCGSGARTVVTGYNVTGQGHDWISTQRNDDNQGNVAPMDASTIMMAFFNSWNKP